MQIFYYVSKLHKTEIRVRIRLICTPVGYSLKMWAEVCNLLAKTVTLFKTKISDFRFPTFNML